MPLVENATRDLAGSSVVDRQRSVLAEHELRVVGTEDPRARQGTRHRVRHPNVAVREHPPRRAVEDPGPPDRREDQEGPRVVVTPPDFGRFEPFLCISREFFPVPFHPRLGVEEMDLAVPARDDEGPPIGAEEGGRHGLGERAERPDRPPGRDLPDPRRPVITPRGEPGASGVEPEAIEDARVAAEGPQGVAGDVPEPHLVVHPRRGEQATVRAEGDIHDRARMRLEARGLEVGDGVEVVPLEPAEVVGAAGGPGVWARMSSSTRGNWPLANAWAPSCMSAP